MQQLSKSRGVEGDEAGKGSHTKVTMGGREGVAMMKDD